MVDAAARAGVEVVKHQTHIVEDEMSGAARKVVPGNATVSIYEIMQRCALSEDDEKELQDYVEAKGMIFMSTPFSRAAADRLQRMNVPAYKIGSGECNNYPLLKHIAAFGKPIILSTGMNTIDSVRKAVDDFRERRRAVRADAHDQSLSDPAPSGATGRDGGARQRLPERGRSDSRITPPTTSPASAPSRSALRSSSGTSPITCSARVRTSSARWTRRPAAS